MVGISCLGIRKISGAMTKAQTVIEAFFKLHVLRGRVGNNLLEMRQDLKRTIMEPRQILSGLQNAHHLTGTD